MATINRSFQRESAASSRLGDTLSVGHESGGRRLFRAAGMRALPGNQGWLQPNPTTHCSLPVVRLDRLAVVLGTILAHQLK